jgi:hypothetical protein
VYDEGLVIKFAKEKNELMNELMDWESGKRALNVDHRNI